MAKIINFPSGKQGDDQGEKTVSGEGIYHPAGNKKAIEKWNMIDALIREELIKNVWCIKCKVTEIIDYKINSDKFGIILNGKCKKCGGDVARLIEDH